MKVLNVLNSVNAILRNQSLHLLKEMLSLINYSVVKLTSGPYEVPTPFVA